MNLRMTLNEEKVFLLLNGSCKGRKNTERGGILACQLQMSSNELRNTVNRLRGKGVPIGSSKEGYFYCATAGEIYSTIHYLKATIRGIERAIAGLERALDSFGENEARRE